MNANLLPPPPVPGEVVPINPNIPPPEAHAEIALSALDAWRRRRAEGVVEKMEHKDHLYLDLGNLAMRSNKNAEQERSTPERARGVLADRRMRKKMIAQNRMHSSRKTFGPDESERFGPTGDKPVPSLRKAAVDSTLGRIPGSAMDGPQVSFARAFWENGKRIVVGPEIRGYSGIKRKIERAVNRGQFMFGRKTALQATERKLEIMAMDSKSGSKELRQRRRPERRRNESLQLNTEQPILSPWRTQRRKRAEKRVERIDAALEAKKQVAHAEQVRKMQENQARAEELRRQNEANNNATNS